MTIVCNIWMICLELNWLFYDLCWMLQLSTIWGCMENFTLENCEQFVTDPHPCRRLQSDRNTSNKFQYQTFSQQ